MYTKFGANRMNRNRAHLDIKLTDTARVAPPVTGYPVLFVYRADVNAAVDLL